MPKGVYKRKETQKKHMSEARRGNRNVRGKHWKLSKKTKDKMSLSKKGHIGVEHTLETREKLRKANTGENSNTWKGGISIGKNKKEYQRFKCLERHSRKMNASGSHTLGEWQILKAQYNWTCPACGKKEPEINLSEDHIIPLIKGGSNNIENIQPLCRSCNSRKNTKIIKYLTEEL